MIMPRHNVASRKFSETSSGEPCPWGVALFLTLLASVPMLGAVFGYGNQVEQFSIIARLRDPGLLAGDLYVDSGVGFGPRIYYAQALAWLNGFMPLPLIVHGLSILCNFALGAVSYYAATRFLRGRALSGALAAVFALTNGSFSLGLAGYLRFDSFQPANLAIPLALIGMVLAIRQRWFWALVPLILAALAHPLIGVEIALIAYVSTGLIALVRPIPPGLLRTLAPAIASGLIFAAAIYVAWVLPAQDTGTLRLSDAEFFDILARFRAPHHYLGLGFPRLAWTQALLFVIGISIALGCCVFRISPTREALTLLLACFIVLVFCAASLLFVDVMQNRIWVTAQAFRMLLLVKWTGMLALGCLMADWIDRDRLAGLIMTGCLALATADAQPYAVSFVMLSIAALTLGPRLIRGRLWTLFRWAGLGLLILLVAAASYRYAILQQSLRAALALAALLLIRTPYIGATVRPMLASLVVAAVLLATTINREKGLFGLPALQAQFIWSDQTGDDIDVARAARALSPPDAIWLVPPDLENFRLYAARPVVADYTSFPFTDPEMREWRARLRDIFGPTDRGGFGALREMKATYRASLDWTAVAQKYNATYAVLLADTLWNGPVLYENDGYKAVRISDVEN